jgi:hypothetical protein
MRVLIPATVAVLAATASGLTSQAPIVIRNVSVIDGRSALPRIGNIELHGDTIASVSPAATALPAGAQVIDGTGRFAIPGLWDMHVHLATRPEPNLAEEMILPLLLAHGIVGARDMGGPLERLIDLRARVASGAIPGPRILTPGPFVDGPGQSGPLFRRPAGAQAVTSEVDALTRFGKPVWTSSRRRQACHLPFTVTWQPPPAPDRSRSPATSRFRCPLKRSSRRASGRSSTCRRRWWRMAFCFSPARLRQRS